MCLYAGNEGFKWSDQDLFWSFIESMNTVGIENREEGPNLPMQIPSFYYINS